MSNKRNLKIKKADLDAKDSAVSRIDIRAEKADKDYILRAAKLRKISLSQFILESSLKAAQETIAEQSHFLLGSEQWKAFCEALDRPAKRIPALTKLLMEPSILEQDPT